MGGGVTCTAEGIGQEVEVLDQPFSLCRHFSVSVLGRLPSSYKPTMPDYAWKKYTAILNAEFEINAPRARYCYNVIGTS
jgi:hypothetical protein